MIGVRPSRPPVQQVSSLGMTDAVWSLGIALPVLKLSFVADHRYLAEMCWDWDWKKRPLISFVLQSLEEAFHQFVPQSQTPSLTDDASSDYSGSDRY